ncbi:hypothetical protein H8356DRAFT_1742891 [Neocallimastix lanati (nom. inval.)]|jgi:hypothetical protein|uniref:Tubby C-terminal domain-containing protein n=1 Tax=Neocallimastix californiae TaxID=1754190 RepID=A0A1Y2B678_9FUNG|nr:hypothetical protein H8356DRAFT_1742891 [Neocallimastix sp. JGI-2020a]ORY29605.1 hypothetical protein LY90DRAFT_705542 [Neocallimastix californiae]|eukprot:ORY29605.1 hypothetical protein LY90DRAFT_705542 [Neocallimastix californiae]
MGYYEDICKKKLESPVGNGLAVVSPIYITKENMTFTVERTTNKLAKYRFKIFDNEGKKVLKGRKTNRKRIIYTMDTNEPIFTVKETNSRKSRKKMYLGKNKKGRFLGIIRAKHDYSNEDRKYAKYDYKVKFHNTVSKKNEFIEMKSDEDESVCALFHGKEKENAPVICKMIRAQDDRHHLTVQIAEGVDYIFVLGLALFFFGLKDFTNTDQKITGRKRIFIDGNRNSYIPDFCSNNVFYFHSDDGIKFTRCWGGPTDSIKNTDPKENDTKSIQNYIFKNSETFPLYNGDDKNNSESFYTIYTGNNTYVRRYGKNDGLVNKDSFYLYYEGKNVYTRYIIPSEVEDGYISSSSCDNGYESDSSYEEDDNIDKMCNLLNSVEINNDFN